jgi:hypothetical protein
MLKITSWRCNGGSLFACSYCLSKFSGALFYMIMSHRTALSLLYALCSPGQNHLYSSGPFWTVPQFNISCSDSINPIHFGETNLMSADHVASRSVVTCSCLNDLRTTGAISGALREVTASAEEKKCCSSTGKPETFTYWMSQRFAKQ